MPLLHPIRLCMLGGGAVVLLWLQRWRRWRRRCDLNVFPVFLIANQQEEIPRVSSRFQLDASSARFGLDIGGSLTKFIYLEQNDEQNDAVLARARQARERAGLEPSLRISIVE